MIYCGLKQGSSTFYYGGPICIFEIFSWPCMGGWATTNQETNKGYRCNYGSISSLLNARGGAYCKSLWIKAKYAKKIFFKFTRQMKDDHRNLRDFSVSILLKALSAGGCAYRFSLYCSEMLRGF